MHPKTGKLARDLKKYRGKKADQIAFTLGDMQWALGLAIGENTIKESPLIQELKKFIDTRCHPGFPTKDYIKQLEQIVRQYRNKAAHPHKLSKEDALQSKEFVFTLIHQFSDSLI